MDATLREFAQKKFYQEDILLKNAIEDAKKRLLQMIILKEQGFWDSSLQSNDEQSERDQLQSERDQL